jgi:dTDP-4-amino-4,6-dideoxygalactose transaminase
VASGEAGIVATNDRELYERALIYCHLHRPGALDELTNPVYGQLEPQLLGWKWRAHPLAMAIGLVSLGHLPYRLSRFEANRDALFAQIDGLPGVRPVRNYPQARGVELYGGMRFVYDPDALSGLPAARFVEAMQAEGAPVRGPGIGHVEHLRALYTRDLPGLWGPGHVGPANIPLPRYREGDFPVSEGLRDRVLSYAGHIEAAEGFIDQLAEAFRKVVGQHEELL